MKRSELMAHRRARTVSLGPSMRLQFEDALTVRHQVAEVMRAERITDPAAIQHEIDTYAFLVPRETEWTATLLIELPDAAQRARELPQLSLAAHHVYAQCEGVAPVFAEANEDLADRHLSRPSAVHFLRFRLPEALRRRVLAGADAALGCTNRHYPWRQPIPAAALQLLRNDLMPSPMQRPRPYPITAACVGAALLASAAAHAQPVEPAETVLPVVRAKAVDEERAAAPVTGYTARRGTTATRTDTPLNEVPQSISVITADQVRDQGSQTMQDVLRYSAGVRAEMYGVDNRGDWFTLRGGSEGSTLLDGLRLPLSGWWGVVRNEPYAFERIEVLRGPASVIAGQNGPGGVINLVSKRPQPEAWREVGVQFGSFGHRQASVDLTGPLDAQGTLLYRLVALAKDSGTQVNHAFDERSFVAPSLTWKPSAATSLTVFAEYQRDESGNLNAFFPYQGTILPAPHGPIPMETFVGEPDWDTYGGERQRVGYQLEQSLAEHWRLRHSLRHDRIDGKLRTMYAAWWLGFADATGAADPNGTHLNRIWYANDDLGRITSADLVLEGKLAWGPTRHTVLVGLDGMRSFADHREWEGDATPLHVYRPVYGSFPLPALGPVDPVVTRMRRVGVLVQDQIKVDDRWVIVAGLRRDRARNAVDGGAAQEDSATTKNFGLVWLADGGWSPYSSYSESFEPVSGADAAGAPFKPMRGKQVEAGVKWQPADRRVTASAAVYKLVEGNRLATDPVNVGQSVQRGEITVQGLEFEGSAHLPAWDLLASATFMDARVTSTTADDVRYLDRQLYGIPRRSASLWALRKFGGLRAGLGLRHVGRTWDGVGLQSVPAVTLADAVLGYERGAWRLALNINNLADKAYVAACLERGDCWFGGRRKALASVTYRF